jgi:hypothetical protein
MDINKDELPDVKAMVLIETRMSYLYYNETTALLPAVRERLLDLITLIKAGNDALREKAVASLVALNLDLNNTSPQLDEEELMRICQDLRAEVGDVTEAIKRVRDYRSPVITELRGEHETVVGKQRDGIAEIEQMLVDKRAKLEEVDALLETLDQPSVRKALRNAIPEESDIDVMLNTLKDPTVSPELIKAALSKLNKHLDLLEQGRKFADVIAARQRLGDALAEQEKTLLHLRKELEQTQQASAQFDCVEELLAKRTPWVEQAGKFIEAWQVHERALVVATGAETLESALRHVRDYLLALRRRFEAL